MIQQNKLKVNGDQNHWKKEETGKISTIVDVWLLYM